MCLNWRKIFKNLLWIYLYQNILGANWASSLLNAGAKVNIFRPKNEEKILKINIIENYMSSQWQLKNCLFGYINKPRCMKVESICGQCLLKSFTDEDGELT
jgi:hypothetical protein